MPVLSDVSILTMPDGVQYNIKDKNARERIAALEAYSDYLGVTTSPLEDGSTTNPVIIGGESVTAEHGNIVNYQSKEFIFNAKISPNQWQEFGDMSALKALAYEDEAVGDYTPTGSVTQPSFTGSEVDVTLSTQTASNGNYTPAGTITAPSISVATAGSMTTIKNPTSVTVTKTIVTAAPGATTPSNNLTYWSYNSSSETLTFNKIGYTTGDSITTANVDVKTGDAAYSASVPTFSGTTVNITGKTTPAGTVSAPNFVGNSATITVGPSGA